MWLVDTSTLQLQKVAESEFRDNTFSYAILSHRWRQNEVTFADMTGGFATGRDGYAKLQGLCRIASSEGHQYAWIDTCCIDKTNNVELSEAINSMYRWYRHAAICIAYLDDVGDGAKPFDASEWFERGWTLQELIAPTCVRFYDRGWTYLGDRDTLTTELSEITQIPQDVLRDQNKVKSCSVAQRMSWAAKRKTERIEDRAYSLMGLFGVHMPLIYGEEDNAFVRLQTEIMKELADQSIFAWSLSSKQPYSGLLATSPSQFEACGNVVRAPGSGSFSIGNLGLNISLLMFPYGMDTYAATLCATDNGVPCAILLTRLDTDGQYARVKNSAGKSVVNGTTGGDNRNLTQVYVQKDPETPKRDTQYGFWLRTLDIPGATPTSTHILSRDDVNSAKDRIFVPESLAGTAGIVLTETPTRSWTWSNVRWLKFGFDWNFNPVCLIANTDQPTHPSLSGLTKRTFDEATTLSSPLRQWTKILDNSSWITDPRGAEPSYTRAWPEGTVTLTGSRQRGFVHKLEAINIQISVKLAPDPISASKDGSQTDIAKKIWVVDITNLDGPSPEKQYYSNECCYGVEWFCGLVFALVGCPCLLQEARQRHREEHR